MAELNRVDTVAERWGGGRPDGRAVFKVGTNKRHFEERMLCVTPQDTS